MPGTVALSSVHLPSARFVATKIWPSMAANPFDHGHNGCLTPFEPLFVWCCTRPPLPVGNGAPGAAEVQAGRFRQRGNVLRLPRPSQGSLVKLRSSSPTRGALEGRERVGRA